MPDKKRRDPLEPVEAIPQVLATRARPRPKRDRSWDRERSKATFDLPPALIARLGEVAGELAAGHPGAKVRVSDVARLLLEAGLKVYDAGDLEITLHPQRFTLFSD